MLKVGSRTPAEAWRERLWGCAVAGDGDPWEELTRHLPSLSQGARLYIQRQGAQYLTEEDPVVFSGRIPGAEAPGGVGGIDMDRWKVREAVRGPSLPRCRLAGYLVPPAQGRGPVSRTALSSDQRWIVGLVSKPTQRRTVHASGPGLWNQTGWRPNPRLTTTSQVPLRKWCHLFKPQFPHV